MDEVDDRLLEEIDKKIIRRKLLPLWIKVFCWIFMITGIGAILSIPIGIFGYPFQMALYGINTIQPISIIGFALTLIYIFKGIVAYALWFEKDYAITLGKFEAIIGIIICILTMFILPLIQDVPRLSFRVEIIFLVLFYIKLNKIEYAWDNQEEQ